MVALCKGYEPRAMWLLHQMDIYGLEVVTGARSLVFFDGGVGDLVLEVVVPPLAFEPAVDPVEVVEIVRLLAVVGLQ